MNITYTQKLAGANSQVYIAIIVSTYQVQIASPHREPVAFGGS